MLKLEDFNRQLRTSFREQLSEQLWRLFPSTALMGLGAGLFGYFASDVYSWCRALYDDERGNLLFLGGMLGSLLPGVLLFVGQSMLGKGRRSSGILCPHCGNKIGEESAITIATRCCVRCGKEVLKVPEEAPVKLLSLEEMQVAIKLYHWKTAAVVVGFIGMVLGSAALVAVILPYSGIDPHIPMSQLPVGQQVMSMLLIFGMFLPAAGITLPLGWLIERDVRIRCPQCRKVLARHIRIVIASQNCPYCGQQVLKAA